MSRYVWAVLCAGVLVACAPPRAGREWHVNEEMAWRGMGGAACQDFLGAIRDDPSFELIFFTWAQGFMSGINADRIFSKVRTADLAGKPLADQRRHIRQFCRTNPDHPYVQAVMDPYFTLPGARLDQGSPETSP